MLEALTERGEFHLSRLHLNRSALVAYRRERAAVAMARAEQADLVARLAQVPQFVRKIQPRGGCEASSEAESFHYTSYIGMVSGRCK
ncbi:MAG: hypothetical protein ACK47B_29205, partial [Armatimonadota bacterium]